MSWRRHLRAAADATEPDGAALDRLRGRAARRRRLLEAAAWEPAPAAVARVRSRAGRPAPGRRPTAWALGLALAAILLAVAVAIPRDRPLDEPLAAVVPTERTLTEDVRLSLVGEGAATGSAWAPRITWHAGTLDVDVTPDRGVDLTVETDEATARVVGTRFQVRRDALGTTIAVERGRVAVRCADDPPGDALLGAGEEHVCRPTRAAGMLARASLRLERGDPTDAVLADVARGLALAAPGDPVRAELLALRLDALVRADRRADIAEAARAYLAEPDAPRRDEVLRLVEVLAPDP